MAFLDQTGRFRNRIFMKKVFLFALLYFSLTPLFSQSKMTLDKTINDFVVKLIPLIPDNSGIAVIAFQSDKPAIKDHLIDKIVEILKKRGENVEVLEREKIDTIIKEIDFSQSGYVTV
jgi:hypothetical protein